MSEVSVVVRTARRVAHPELVVAPDDPRAGLDDHLDHEHDAGPVEPIDAGEASQLADLFRLLGDPGRVRILYALLEAGEMCVSHLADAVEAPETSVSHALRLLRTAGAVRNRRGGRNVYYSLDDAHVRLLLELSRQHLRHGTPGGDR
jgi:DNA-binding transcriptional ArsR family regulator